MILHYMFTNGNYCLQYIRLERGLRLLIYAYQAEYCITTSFDCLGIE